MNRKFTHRLERADVEGWASHQSHVPRDVVEHFGFQLERPRGATFMIATRTETLGLNRALGIGAFEELTPETLDESIEIYRSRGVTKAILQISPEVIPPAMNAEIAARGIGFKTRRRRSCMASPPWRRTEFQTRERPAHRRPFARSLLLTR